MNGKSWHHKKDLMFDKPSSDSNVWPHQYCPAFTPRSEGHRLTKVSNNI